MVWIQLQSSEFNVKFLLGSLFITGAAVIYLTTVGLVQIVGTILFGIIGLAIWLGKYFLNVLEDISDIIGE